jgi:hypothetical protein
MQTQPEAPASGVGERASDTAFGLRLEVDPSIAIPGLSDLAAPIPSNLAGAARPDLDIRASANLAGAARPDLDIRASVRASGDPLISTSPSQEPTYVRLDPDELARRWRAAAPNCERVRELREGELVVLTVDLALPAGYLLQAPGIGRILIAPDGGELICDPAPDSSEWVTLLPAQALPLAATLRGFEVLHAAGVVLGGRAVLLAGEPGAGKSSLAAALLRQGAGLLSDDAVALEQRGAALIAHPGVGLLHLRPAEHRRLSLRERGALGTETEFLDRRRYLPETSPSPVPFGELLLLERATPGVPLERIEAVDPFALLASTFNLSVRTPERLARHLDVTVALAATERIYRLRVQPGTDATQLAEIVSAQLAAPPA